MARNLPTAVGWLVAIAVAALPPGPVLRAESPAAGDPGEPPRLQRLVGALGAGSLEARDAAERSILELGPSALPALLEAGADATGEAAFRLRGIRRALEQQAVAAAIDGSTITATVTGSEPVGRNGVRIVLRVAWENAAAPIVVKLPMQSVVAEGPGGEVLPPAQKGAVLEAAVPANRRWLELPLSLVQPDPPLRRLGLLRGTLTVWITGMEQEFAFTDIGRGAAATGEPRAVRLGSARVTLDEAVPRRDRLLVTASVAYDAPSEALASHHPWLTERPLELVAPDGTVTAAVAQTVRRRSERGLTTTAEFPWPPAAARSQRDIRLRWKLPLAIHELPVDFAIRDISLPEDAR